MSVGRRALKGREDVEPVRILGRGLRAQRGVRLTLRGLRDAAGKTQAEVAEAAKVDQGDISRLEGKADFGECQVATLRRYIEALGGRMEVAAIFGDKRIVVAGAVPDGGGGDRPHRRPRAGTSDRAR